MRLKTHFVLFLVVTMLIASGAPALAEEKPAAAPSETQAPKNPSAGSLISANGFSCSSLEGQTLCQGKFAEVDKNLTIGAKGSGEITLRAMKDETLFTYSSQNGCLCQEKKGEMACQNAQGKKSKFKGDKMKQESASFCAIKK